MNTERADGSAVVDVSVCADFDQPVRYVEALVSFVSARGSTPGVAIISKPGIRTTFWCGAKYDLLAGPPGTVRIDVTWSADNGNGFSMGHASSGGSFTVPGPPPVRKFNPRQKRTFSRNGQFSFGVSMAIGIAGIAVAIAFGPVSILYFAVAAASGGLAVIR